MTSTRSDAAANRTRLMNAARKVFAQMGLSAEIKDIAAEAGLGAGTLYRNFASKEDLVLALLAEAARLNERPFTEIEESAITDAVEQLRLVLVRSFEALKEYGWLLEALWSGQLPPRWRDRFRPSENVEHLRRILINGIGQGAFRRDLDIEMAIGMFAGPLALGGFLGLAARPADAAADKVLELFLDGAARA